jgi:NAD(P) transhydrogenase subunit beta
MTAMPQMVSIFNGMGGACAALISLVEYNHLVHNSESSVNLGTLSIILLGLIIGSVSFAGSMIAWGKLNGNIKKDFAFLGQQFINIGILLAILGLSIFLVLNFSPENSYLFYVIFILSLLYGLLFVFPIGGADMPVVISLLNSFTGVAAACGGFLYDNKVMLTGGILVGAAGTLLTILMCNAMNRSLLNVLIGSFGGNKKSEGGSSSSGGTVKKLP